MATFIKSKKLWYWFLAIALIFIIHFSGLIKPLENFFLRKINLINYYFHQAGSSKYRELKEGSAEDLLIKLEQTREQLARSSIDEAQTSLLLEENSKLRQQLDFLSNNKYRAMSANIVARQSLFSNVDKIQDIILDRGSADGIVPGLAVIDEQGIIIGKIVESKENSARACLTVAPDCRLAVAILNKDKTIGLSDGNLGLTIKINFIPQLEEISLGDIVISSGLGDNIPRGVVVGRVTQVNKQSNEIWQDVSIESLASIYSLTVVSVILP